jgi:hypothetical protein
MKQDSVLMRTTIRLAWVMVAVFAAACGGAALIEWENGSDPRTAPRSAPPVILPS